MRGGRNVIANVATVRPGRPGRGPAWLVVVALWPLVASGDAGELASERSQWLADKRTDPLDLGIEPDVERIRSAIARGDCEAALPTAREVLQPNPFQLAALDAVASCADSDAQRAEAATRRDAIVELVERSGSGADLFSPWRVVSWTETFDFLRMKGLRPEEHRTGCGRTEHLIIRARSADGSLDSYYFDIHGPYRACRTRTGCRVEDRGIPRAIAPR
jgi:hypothetical protein